MNNRRGFSVLLLAAVILSVWVLVKLYKVSSGMSSHRDLHKLELVLRQIEDNYVDTIDYRNLSEALVKEALHTLDPHSVYLPPRELEVADEDLQGEFDGIGITFNVPSDTAIVINTIPQGPSEKAGLLSGDRIITIDGINVAGVKIPQDSLIRLLRGPAGSSVSLGIKRHGVDVLIPFDVQRAKIPVHSVDCSFMLNDTTGYVRLSKFSRTTYVEVLMACDKLLKQGMTRLIFDLRDNLGGYLDQAVLLSNEFLDKGDLIMYFSGRMRERKDFYADGSGALANIGLDVLINESSASSSEIFAGAMQDNDRGIIYGRRSFGKGLVQEQIYFSDGSGMRLTVAKYYTPSGRCIQKPYTPGDDESYRYDLIQRYVSGEMLDADSIKVNDSLAYYTLSGRKVYGGGGIIPDVFVPIDTTSANDFYLKCQKMGLPVRFSTEMNDRYRDTLAGIETFSELNAFMDSINLEEMYLDYVRRQGLNPSAKEWNEMKHYLMVQVRAFTGRYSALGEEAFYRIFLEIDDICRKALYDTRQSL